MALLIHSSVRLRTMRVNTGWSRKKIPRAGSDIIAAASFPLLPVSKSPDPVWLFDLDNTLHDASHAIFPAISANMNTYIARVLGDGVTPAIKEAA
jgi:hypothetical protein